MNGDLRDYTRAELLELTPARYLAEGFVDRKGLPHASLQTTYATAAATQFLAADLSPQELAFTFEALKQTLPLHAGKAAQRAAGAAGEALDIVRGLIRQPNNRRLEQWIKDCTTAVKTEADLDALLGHFMAVLRQYSVIAASLPRSS